jgi:LysM repeat protein
VVQRGCRRARRRPSTRSLPAYDDEYPEDAPPERVIPISARRREPVRPAAAGSYDEEEREPRPRRPRRAPTRRARRESGIIERHALSIAAAAIAVLVLGYVLSQLLAAGGQRATPTPAPTAASTPNRSGAAAASDGEEVAAKAAPSAEVTTPEPLSTPQIVRTVTVLEPNYTVKSGDTLGKIAERSGNTVDSLQALNKLEDRGKLDVGQKLIVPGL